MDIKSMWYYADGDNTIGPFDRNAMAKMAHAKILDANTLLICDGSETWIRFGDSSIHEFLPQADAQPETVTRAREKGKTMLGNVQGFVCGFSGLAPLEAFRPSLLVRDVFKARSRSDVDEYFNCGCAESTPPLQEVVAVWPKPWFYLRLLGFGAFVLSAFCFALVEFENEKVVPGLMIVGAFFVPLTCVALFFELNVLRNVSLYRVIKFIVTGGILSIVFTLFLYSTTRLETFMGAMSAGIVEEVAKTLTAVFLLWRASQYRWILNGLLVGGAVGAGFAGFESAGYMFDALLHALIQGEGLTSFFQSVLVRAVLAPFGHVVWTACVVGALWRVKRDGPFHLGLFFRWGFLRVLLFVMLLHMLWNSGLLWRIPDNTIFFRGEIYLMLTSFVGSWYLLFLLVQEGLLQVKEAQTALQ